MKIILPAQSVCSPPTFRVKVSQLTPSTHVLSPCGDEPPAAVPTQLTDVPVVGLSVSFVGLAALLPLFTKIAIATSRKATAVSVILVCRIPNELMRRGREFVDMFVSPLSISLL